MALIGSTPVNESADMAVSNTPKSTVATRYVARLPNPPPTMPIGVEYDGSSRQLMTPTRNAAGTTKGSAREKNTAQMLLRYRL